MLSVIIKDSKLIVCRMQICIDDIMQYFVMLVIKIPILILMMQHYNGIEAG